MQQNTLLVLGPRRVPQISCPASNTNSAVSTLTSVGFGTLEVEDYVAAVERLKPDFALGMGDIIPPDGTNSVQVGLKRKEKMGERTFTWVRALVDGLDEKREEDGISRTVLLAPILPIEPELQGDYLSELHDNPKWAQTIGGLVLYDNASIEAIPSEISHLPRLSLSCPATPHALLHAVSLGIDLFTLPFINEATEGGIAFSFSFQSQPQTSTSKHLLGYDMWLPAHSKDVSALVNDCKCYACTHHHKAYINHLLSAKEMLAWVLLQIHNHFIIDQFFADVRSSIQQGNFDALQNSFTTTYESDFPFKTGQGPRYVFPKFLLLTSSSSCHECHSANASFAAHSIYQFTYSNRIRGYQHHHTGPTKSKNNPPLYRNLSNPPPLPHPNNNTSSTVVGTENGDRDPDSQWPIPDLPAHDLEAVGFAKVDG